MFTYFDISTALPHGIQAESSKTEVKVYIIPTRLSIFRVEVRQIKVVYKKLQMTACLSQPWQEKKIVIFTNVSLKWQQWTCKIQTSNEHDNYVMFIYSAKTILNVFCTYLKSIQSTQLPFPVVKLIPRISLLMIGATWSGRTGSSCSLGWRVGSPTSSPWS